MKKILLLSTLILILNLGYSQGINFQGVARSANGTIIASSNVGLRLSIISKNVDATPEYIETKTVVTNAQGIFSIVVGDAANTAVTGSFKNIVWSDGPKFLKVEMDPAGGTNYLNMGATQLQYVPYSFYSYGVDASNVKGIVPVKAGGTGVATLEELKSALNIVIPPNIDTNSLSNRINSKLSSTDTASLSNRINSFSTVLTQDNRYNIKLGKNITTNVPEGYWNIGIGGSNLLSNTSGDRNIGIGAYALSSNITGRYNIAIGSDALSRNVGGWGNNAIGLKSIGSNTNGFSNSALGMYSLQNNTIGNENTALGHYAGASLVTGSGNIFLGNGAGFNNDFINISNKLIIANSGTNTPLIYGDFANKKLKFNANIDSLSILNRINFVDENANDHINRYDTGYNSPLIYSRYFYGHYGDLIIQGMSKTYTGNIHFVTGSNISGYESPRQRMVIMDNGNVGIGDFVNTPPTSKLQVNGVVSAAGYKIPGGTSTQYLRADGTVTTSVTSGVPYTGASQATNLGPYDLTVNGITVGVGSGTASATTNTAVGNKALFNNSNGENNVAIGYNAMLTNTTGSRNLGIGNNSLKMNTTGNQNIGLGFESLINNTTGSMNISLGGASMWGNTTGTGNAAIGNGSLLSNTTGSYNVALGYQPLWYNVLGSDNVAIGQSALFSNVNNSGTVAVGFQAMSNADNRTSGINTGNTAVGYQSLKGSSTPANNTGRNNTALGYQTMVNNTSGNSNSAFGNQALLNNTTGDNNTAIGQYSMLNNTSGANNTALGINALYTGINTNNVTAIGKQALEYNLANNNTSVGFTSLRNTTTGGDNTAFGYEAGITNTTGNYNTLIGHQADVAYNNLTNAAAIGKGAIVSTSNTIQLGNTSITNVNTSGILSSSGIKVGTTSSTQSAIVEISSTTKGFLPPRMTGVQRDAISSPVQGLIIYCTDCGGNGGQPQYYNGSSWRNMLGDFALEYPIVGRAMLGGVVAYILQPGDLGYVSGETHGLIATIADYPSQASWGCNGSQISGADNLLIGYGDVNTNDIITGCNESTIAAKICNDLIENSYSDWFLPSKDELNKLYINRSAIGGFTTFTYTSSSEFDNNNAWSQWFNNGSQGAYPKNATLRIRPIRKF